MRYQLKRKDGSETMYLLKDDRKSFTDYKLNTHHTLNYLNSYVSLSTSLSLMEGQLNHKVNTLKKVSKITGNITSFSNAAIQEGIITSTEKLLKAGD